MSEHTTTRRTFVRGIGSAVAVSGVGVLAADTATAATYREIEVDGGANDDSHGVDYHMEVNSGDVSALGDTESNDNVYNYSSSTSIYGTVKGNGGVDTYEIPKDAAMTYLRVDGEKDGSHVQLYFDSRDYGKQHMAFRGLENPGWSKLEYSATSDGDFSKKDDVEGYPEDTAICDYGTCALSGKVKADKEDVWTLNGDSPDTLALDTLQKGGRFEVDIDVVSPDP
jgi:hypothetical protein